jgi:hypothetical protein
LRERQVSLSARTCTGVYHRNSNNLYGSSNELRVNLSNPILKPIHWILIGVILLVLIGFLGFHRMESPRFIELDIPSPIAYLPNGSWDYTSFTTYIPEGSYQRYFIWRREGRAYGKSESNNFDSQNNVLSFFEEELNRRGWYRVVDLHDFYKCPMVFSDLDRSSEVDVLIEQFNKLGDDPFDYDFVCILSRQTSSWDNEPRFEVALVSFKPSPLTWLILASD